MKKTKKDLEAHTIIRKTGKVFIEIISENVPEGRERSIAIMKIQEAVMWAHASISLIRIP